MKKRLEITPICGNSLYTTVDANYDNRSTADRTADDCSVLPNDNLRKHNMNRIKIKDFTRHRSE